MILSLGEKRVIIKDGSGRMVVSGHFCLDLKKNVIFTVDENGKAVVEYDADNVIDFDQLFLHR
ncbi:MAG: hypothetical protein M1505_02400 [Patescibacteria group bacterium]|nr:hypothetical protein [Patescibacteria group bacterium]